MSNPNFACPLTADEEKFVRRTDRLNPSGFNRARRGNPDIDSIAKSGSKTGRFITFEGIEGSGKTTQIKLLEQYLRAKGRKTLILWEPGATSIGEDVRRVLLSLKNKQMADKAELLLYSAARAQLIQEKILPALCSGKIVICDRFFDSTLAYQGYGAGQDLTAIRRINKFVTEGLSPDLTLLLDLPVKQGLRRCQRNDRIEKKSVDFHNRVRQGYLALQRHNSKRIKIIRVDAGIYEIQGKIRGLVDKLLKVKKD